MKRLSFLLVFISCACSLFAQDNPVWLTSLKEIERSWVTLTSDYRHETLVMGGVEYNKAISVGAYSSLVKKEYGYIDYDLEGKYETLTFIFGILNFQAHDVKGIMVVEADGKRIVDKVISADEANHYMSLDVTGVHKLRFTLAHHEVQYGIAMPALWKKGQTPREMAPVTEAKPKTTMLCRDLMPYKKKHTIYSSNTSFYKRGLDYEEAEDGEIRLSGNTYKDGIYCNAQMALIGNAVKRTHFNLGGLFETLSFVAGPIDTDDGTLQSGWLTVKSDGKIIYEKEIIEGKLSEQVTLNIKGCNTLSFITENSTGSLDIGIANIMVYPQGQAPNEESASSGAPVEKVAAAPEYLKNLPDQCRLIKNIPPFAIGGGMSRESALFEDKSQFVTFTMGGVKHSEGVVLQSSTSFFHNNTGAHVMFNLGGEFDYVSFTTGWVAVCGVLKNDWLRVYADDELVLQVELVATDPNKAYLVPINKCKVLKFEKLGMSSFNHPAFGLGDMVVYRGEPKLDHGLFTHPVPECPDEIDLIDLNPPYIHYVSSAMDVKKVFDGTSKKEYFSMPGGERIYKGFLLKTSVHFDLEMGPGSDPQAGAIAPMLGSSVMIGSVGGVTVSAVSAFGALIGLAAGGTAHEASLAAFNTWGEYDMLTFTVACRLPHNTIDPIDIKQNPMEKLLIGADKQVVGEFYIHDKMEPTTYTVPLNKCQQLMFWLECGGSNSGQFIFYDLKLSKGKAAFVNKIPPVEERDSHPSILADPGQFDFNSDKGALKFMDLKWPNISSSSGIRDFKSLFNTNMTQFEELIDNINSVGYVTVCRQVVTKDGQEWRSFRVQSPTGEKYSYLALVERNKQIIRMLKMTKLDIATLKTSRVAASATLLEVEFKYIKQWKNLLKEAGDIINAYQDQFEKLIQIKEEENRNIGLLINSAVTLDGIASTEKEIFIK